MDKVRYYTANNLGQVVSYVYGTIIQVYDKNEGWIDSGISMRTAADHDFIPKDVVYSR